MIVYKYLAPDRVDVLENGMIRFTQPEGFNDLFEALPCYTDYLDGIIDKLIEKNPQPAHIIDPNERKSILAGWAVQNIPRLLGSNFALLCLSKRNDSVLMWSHYANSHQGFLIGLDSESSFFASGRLTRNGLKEVAYSSTRYVMPAGGLKGAEDALLETVNDQVFFTKSVDWAYEEEMRLLAHPSQADKRIPVKDGVPILLYQFPADSVKEIVFGYRTKQSVIDAIIPTIEKKYPAAKVMQATIHDREFRLWIKPYSGR